MKSILKRAAANGTTIEMIYQDCKGNISQRRIRVISISDEGFKAYCFVRKQQRTFKLSNVLSIGPTRNIRRGA